MNDYRAVYDILSEIYKQRAFASIALSRKIESADNRDFVTRFVYGVLARDVELNWYIGALTSKKPQNSVLILLKMGMYCVEYMDSVPDYAAVNTIVELAKKVGKSASSGFVNGVLKSFCRARPALPEDRTAALSVTASVPLWIVKAYVKQYGFDKTREFLTVAPEEREHMRVDVTRTTMERVKSELDALGADYAPDPALDDCLFVRNSPKLKKLLDSGICTFQSRCSVLCCNAADVTDGCKILDMCAAPGGKSVCLASRAKDVSVTACDIYHHRLELIAAYARRMRRDIDVRLMDATEYNAAMASQYDIVLCDVPCSNLGVAAKKPDVYLFREPSSIDALAEEQYKILCNGAKYVRVGGEVIYSTCTLLKEENCDVVKRFMRDHRGYTFIDSCQYLPDGSGTDGFFVAKLRRDS